MEKKITFFLAALAVMILGSLDSADAKKIAIGFFVGDSDGYNCSEAFGEISIPQVEIAVFTRETVQLSQTQLFLKRMDIGVVDIMPREPAGLLLASQPIVKPTAKIYAVRSSSHTQDYLNAGVLMDPVVRRYYQFTSSENLKNLVLFLLQRDFSINTRAAPPVIPPANALYHPEAPEFFASIDDYVDWYRKTGRFQKGQLWDLVIAFPNSVLNTKKAPLDALVRAYEKQGINTVTWLREVKSWDATLADFILTGPLKDNIGSISGLGLKFSAMLSPELLDILQVADIPVFNPQQVFFSTGEEWRTSAQGMSPVGVSVQFSAPELSGMIEPGVVGVKERVVAEGRPPTGFRFLPVAPMIEKQARRTARWHRLRQMANKDKKVVLLYYNHGAGKQNIGASYLNVFRSIEQILLRMQQEDYTINGDITEKKVKKLLISSGRNIGAWAPSELDHMVGNGNVVTVSIEDYKRWLSQTDLAFQGGVEKDWGRPEDSLIMVKNGRFIIPCITLGNLILVPQPSRGWCDDPEKLYHSTTLYPHHQYVAFYLWLQHAFKPDAMISLGTHGTHEWLPGKQAGLSHACPSEVLIGDVPNLYPYIVDDVGEGIQAKRRGRGVVIDHATPPFKRSGLYAEYSKLAAWISEYEASLSPPIRAAKLERIKEIVMEQGLHKDLGVETITDKSLEVIEHHLLAIKTGMVPFGLHTFGVSSTGEALTETAAAIAGQGETAPQFYEAQLAACGLSEIDSLMRGLRGGYIQAAAGGDPIRNPESLPTGKNFYGFDPEKVPSKAAWESGKKAAQELIDQYANAHEGKYPEQIGVVLWSTETIRDEGINVATALYLLGMRPVWDHRDKVKTTAPISGKELGRPRIDVLLQMSGLFRDSFPSVALRLDRAVKAAAVLEDVENFIKKHTAKIYDTLVRSGTHEKEARKLSSIRLFSAPPGEYGTKVEDFAGASGMWEDDAMIAEKGFMDVVSYGYSSDVWGTPQKTVYRENLKKIDATVHSISSNLYGTMDNDDMFQYLGGLSMAVREASGKDPDVFVSMQRNSGKGHVEPLAATIGKEIRSRYLNPRWIEGMKQEKYAGAREMSDFMENMWGWQVTTPKAVDDTLWQQAYEVYVEDKYGMEIAGFFNEHNPWAYQSMTARMLEAVRKDYWQTDEKVTQKLAAEYAVNVVEKGVACCDHTCNNPMLNQMVVNIISLPGVLSPEMVEKFKLAIEKAADKSLEDQVAARAELLSALEARPNRTTTNDQIDDQRKAFQNRETVGAKDSEPVEGYKMEEMNTQDTITDLSSSGIQWAASLFVLLLMGLFLWGLRHRR